MSIYSHEAIKEKMKHDIAIMESMVEGFTSVTTKEDFLDYMCSWCPYDCRHSYRFCYDRFTASKENYIKLMKNLLTAYYSRTCIHNYNYFRTVVCGICDEGCQYVSSQHACTKSYLSQFRDTKPFGVYGQMLTDDGTKALPFNPPAIFQPTKTMPMLNVNGGLITTYINDLWGVEEEQQNNT